MKGIFCRYLLNSGHQKKYPLFMSGYFFDPKVRRQELPLSPQKWVTKKKHTHLLVGMFFFAQEIDPCQEFANSAKQNLAADLKIER